jgi:hypothetical protein
MHTVVSQRMSKWICRSRLLVIGCWLLVASCWFTSRPRSHPGNEDISNNLCHLSVFSETIARAFRARPYGLPAEGCLPSSSLLAFQAALVVQTIAPLGSFHSAAVQILPRGCGSKRLTMKMRMTMKTQGSAN